MLLSIIFALFLLFVVPGSSATQSYTALNFKYDTSSYISFNPDMSALTDKLSVCLWIRKLQSGNTPCPFSYKSYEIFMVDSGQYNRLFGSYSLDGKLNSKFTVPQGTWYLYCATWSLASRTFRVYVNGQLAGTQTTPSGRRLQTGGALVLGNYSPGSSHRFGGEMYNFNMFSKELTATEVATMSAIGVCTQIPEQVKEYRVIKWEEILKLSRSGTVRDFIDPRCAAAEELKVVKGKLQLAVSEKKRQELARNETQSELLKMEGMFNSTQEELVEVRGKLETSEGELNETKIELEDTKTELEETKLELKNVTESKCALMKGNLTKWDIFYAPEYYNKTFTRRLYRQHRETWDSISSQLFGVTMTDTIIKLIKKLDDGESCGDIATGES